MKHVSMYTLSTCPWCRKTKKYFAATASRSRSSTTIFSRLSRNGSNGMKKEVVPVPGADRRRLVVSWNPARYDELLALSKLSWRWMSRRESARCDIFRKGCGAVG